METGKLFRGAFPVLEKALDLRSMKHNLIVSNIANKDTPDYKAFDLIVEEELAKSGEKWGGATMTKTDDAHLSGSTSNRMIGRSMRGKGEELALRGDGNSVDIDKEMAKLSENNLLYDTLAQILSRKFQGLKDVIKGGV
ncbi:MAG: flagellar basal body rod protein FlgB [Deltaproteobacteria bacterium]|jgi:flagellar basal-body rod protein FlgB|nr:flagellar basal body rod protein FlgB [Deltaproteobacteria bacterium]